MTSDNRLVTPAESPLVARLAVALCAGACAAALSASFGGAGDLDPVLFGARAWAAGENPYQLVGPHGRAFVWPWGLYYPLPALAVVLPFAATLSTSAARAAFAGVSVALLGYGLAARSWIRLPALLSASCLYAVVVGQWSPLLTAAALLPGAAVFLAAKPNLGLALWAADPRWRRLVPAAAALLGTAVLWRWWPAGWWTTVASEAHLEVPARVAWGLPLLALLRWRRPEARVVAALACVPQNGFVYEALPLLAFVPETRAQVLTLALASYAVPIGVVASGPATYAEAARASTTLLLACCYLPCVALVLRRPNEGPVPGWMSRLAIGLGGGRSGRRGAHAR
ncbi:MAG: hypothetical protein ACJ79S_07085 [Gemmatimonadaceae bacterium]